MYIYAFFLFLINLKVGKRFLIKKILNEPGKTDLWQIKQPIDGADEKKEWRSARYWYFFFPRNIIIDKNKKKSNRSRL